MECLLAKRAALRRNEAETYRSSRVKVCMSRKHVEYLVKFVDYADPCWVCECDIGESALLKGLKADQEVATSAPAVQAAAERRADTLEWRLHHQARPADSLPPSARTRHAGQQAADLQSKESGDFKDGGEWAREVGCNNLKESQYELKNERTAGILALVSSCGLFVAVDELIGAESLTQVHLFLFAVFFIAKVPPPKVLAYDDACHLLKFWQLREAKSAFVQWLFHHQKMQLVVDRFHFRNHDAPFCRKWVDPSKCNALHHNTQTEAAEQSFSWLARSKHMFCSMNEGAFQFMMIHLLSMRNSTLVGKPLHV